MDRYIDLKMGRMQSQQHYIPILFYHSRSYKHYLSYHFFEERNILFNNFPPVFPACLLQQLNLDPIETRALLGSREEGLKNDLQKRVVA